MMESIRPHVLILGPALGPVNGGVSTCLNHLFDSDLRTTYRLSFFQVGHAGRSESRAGYLARIVTSPFQLLWRLIRDVPEVVHINTAWEMKGYWRDLTYMIVAKLCGRRVVYQIHGGPYPQLLFKNSRLLTRLVHRTLLCADVVVVLSAQHRKAFGDFAPEASLVTIPYGVEVEKVDLSFARYAPDRPLEIVNLGRLVRPKGVFEVVEALRILRSRGIPFRFRFVGSGPDEDALKAAVTAAGLDESVSFLGTVFGAPKSDLWRSATVLALPTHREGLPLTLLESMSAGVVPVISPVGGIPHAVQDGVHGLFVTPRQPIEVANAIQQLHEDRQRLWRMAIAARAQIVDRFSVTRFAADLHRVYAQLSSAR